jgi:hypothetical protein
MFTEFHESRRNLTGVRAVTLQLAIQEISHELLALFGAF